MKTLVVTVSRINIKSISIIPSAIDSVTSRIFFYNSLLSFIVVLILLLSLLFTSIVLIFFAMLPKEKYIINVPLLKKKFTCISLRTTSFISPVNRTGSLSIGVYPFYINISGYNLTKNRAENKGIPSETTLYFFNNSIFKYFLSFSFFLNLIVMYVSY